MPTFSADQLRRIGSDIFEALGAPREDAKLVGPQ
jgi:hypothetical protein